MLGGWVGWSCLMLFKLGFTAHSGSYQSPAWIQNSSWSQKWQKDMPHYPTMNIQKRLQREQSLSVLE